MDRSLFAEVRIEAIRILEKFRSENVFRGRNSLHGGHSRPVKKGRETCWLKLTRFVPIEKAVVAVIGRVAVSCVRVNRNRSDSFSLAGKPPRPRRVQGIALRTNRPALLGPSKALLLLDKYLCEAPDYF